MVQVLEQLYLNHIIGLIKNLNIPNTIFKTFLIRINYPEYRTHIHEKKNTTDKKGWRLCCSYIRYAVHMLYYYRTNEVPANSYKGEKSQPSVNAKLKAVHQTWRGNLASAPWKVTPLATCDTGHTLLDVVCIGVYL